MVCAVDRSCARADEELRNGEQSRACAFTNRRPSSLRRYVSLSVLATEPPNPDVVHCADRVSAWIDKMRGEMRALDITWEDAAEVCKPPMPVCDVRLLTVSAACLDHVQELAYARAAHAAVKNARPKKEKVKKDKKTVAAKKPYRTTSLKLPSVRGL